MSIIIVLLIGFIALLHLYISWFEIFAWNSKGKKVFKSFPDSLFDDTKQMAANQGLYNGFLAAGLIWSIIVSDPVWEVNIAMFFLICVAIAGIFGAFTVERKILFVQTIPALLTITLILLMN